MDHLIFVSASILSSHTFTNVSSKLRLSLPAMSQLLCNEEQLTVTQISQLSSFFFLFAPSSSWLEVQDGSFLKHIYPVMSWSLMFLLLNISCLKEWLEFLVMGNDLMK